MPNSLVRSYTRSFDHAPKIARGAKVLLERLDPKNPAWFFGRDPNGVSGYFPVQWFAIEGNSATALRDYNAAELTVEAGAQVAVVERYGGWALVRSEDGNLGWIPEECIG